MPYDLTDLDKWVLVPGEGGIDFRTTDPRQVRLEVLSEGPTALNVSYKEDGKKHDHFIGVFVGYDVVKFQMNGPFRLSASGPGCRVWTPEIQNAGAVEIPEAVSFTTMMNRRTRNPELELMMHKMQQNMERRIARTERDLQLAMNPERRIAQLEKQIAEFRAQTAREAESIIETSGDEDDELDAAAPDAGDGDGLQKRGAKPRRSKVAS